MASPILTNQSAGNIARAIIGEFAAFERVSFVTRYAFQVANDSDEGEKIEGPYFRIRPQVGQDIMARALNMPGKCADGDVMYPQKDTGQSYQGWQNAGAPAIGAVTLKADEDFYEIDAARGASFSMSVPFSVEAVTTSEGTWVWDIYRCQIAHAQDRMSARLIQTRIARAGQTRVLNVPRGCHRVAIYGSVASLTLSLEDSGKEASLITLPVPAQADGQWGQYHPIMNASVFQIAASPPNGAAHPAIACFEIELP